MNPSSGNSFPSVLIILQVADCLLFPVFGFLEPTSEFLAIGYSAGNAEVTSD